MPSLSSLLKLRSESQNDNRLSLKLNPEKVQRRKSKRNYLRSLLKVSSFSSQKKLKKDRIVTVPAPISPNNPSSPMSNHNKPLPPPPHSPKEEPQPESTAIRPTKKLDRIITPLSVQDLHDLFSGAPQFYARSEGHYTGAPHPSVAFPWNLEVQIRDLSDHVQIQDEAWGCVTAWPHITREAPISLEALKDIDTTDKERARFIPRCRERPNMLSMQGIERGTVGYQAALEMGVADALQEPEETFPESGPESLLERRRRFMDAKDGIRPLEELAVYEHLISVGVTYHENPMKHERPTVELYTELFTQILFPPSRVTDTEDPYSLQVQIEVLVKVLSEPYIWVDFSLVEWRIRLGQILWGQTLEGDPEDDISINSEIVHEAGAQKYWLLLQILLSCELLMRLDTVSRNISQGLEPAKPAEVKKLEKLMTPVVKWSLILARSWLENIRIEQHHSEFIPEKKPTGWLATLTGAAATTTTNNTTGEDTETYQFRGRHETRQLSGLLHFARRMRWPNYEKLAVRIAANDINISQSVQNTPASGTPMSISTQKSSYFTGQRPNGPRRGLSRSVQRLSALVHSSGWLSNSYISGLILPGEGLSHFLISTLLENDEEAVAKLGEEANLYGGFVFSERSFWSTACIVGRILAAGKDVSECMGWISSGVKPRGITREAWVNIDVEGASHESRETATETPRILQKASIERDGSIIGGADPSSILPGDFVTIHDIPTSHPPAILFESLDLFAIESDDATPTEEKPTPATDMSVAPSIKTYSAMMRFLVDFDDDEKREVNVALTHDVHFVTAHPCATSHSLEALNSPTSPSPLMALSDGGEGDEFPGLKLGHPLHKAFTYTSLPLHQLLNSPASRSLTSLLLSPPSSPSSEQGLSSSTHTSTSGIDRVLIVDCTSRNSEGSAPPSPPEEMDAVPGVDDNLVPGRKSFGSDAEMLARAICAERGWNALVSRRGRGCLACAVREAGALGWGVVLRV
ncbi:helicase protein [Rutstroemia sp. NJR-2017a WRK4]|nr:helicase protein [Rutstroemia sp. NJR-2017a WRK4]